MYTQLGSKCEV